MFSMYVKDIGKPMYDSQRIVYGRRKEIHSTRALENSILKKRQRI